MRQMPSTISGPATPRPWIDSRTPPESPCSAASTAARRGSMVSTATVIAARVASAITTAAIETRAPCSVRAAVVTVGGRPFIRLDLQIGGQLDLAAASELQVDGLVRAVSAEEPDQHRQPAADPDFRLFEDRAPEDDLPAAELVVVALVLLHAVDEDLERRLRPARQPDAISDRDAALWDLPCGAHC